MTAISCHYNHTHTFPAWLPLIQQVSVGHLHLLHNDKASHHPTATLQGLCVCKCVCVSVCVSVCVCKCICVCVVCFIVSRNVYCVPLNINGLCEIPLAPGPAVLL